MKIKEQLLQIAGSQHGTIAKFQLADLGIPKSTVAHHLRSREFVLRARGTYSLLGTPDTWHQQATIAVLANGRGALLSHTSALKNLGVLDKGFNDTNVSRDHFDRELQRFHVVTNRNIRNDKDYFIHRSISIKKLPIPQIVNGIPQVTVERAIIESAGILGPAHLDNVVFSALKKNLTSIGNLSNELAQTHTAPGRSKAKLGELLKNYAKNNAQKIKMESILEKRVYDLLNKTLNLDVHTQFPIYAHGRQYRADFAIPKEKIVIEVDGHAFHWSREHLDSDRRRQNDIASAGWRILRVTAKFSNREIVDSLQSLRYSNTHLPA